MNNYCLKHKGNIGIEYHFKGRRFKDNNLHQQSLPPELIKTQEIKILISEEESKKLSTINFYCYKYNNKPPVRNSENHYVFTWYEDDLERNKDYVKSVNKDYIEYSRSSEEQNRRENLKYYDLYENNILINPSENWVNE